MASVLPSDAAAGNGAAAVDRRELLQSLSIAQQWRHISSQPRIMRLWHAVAAFGSGTLVLVVYVFGWRRHGASWLMVTPAIAYASIAYATGTAFNTVGMISPVNILGPVNGALQMYYMVYPLFQAVGQVWQIKLVCHEHTICEIGRTDVCKECAGVETFRKHNRAPHRHQY